METRQRETTRKLTKKSKKLLLGQAILPGALYDLKSIGKEVTHADFNTALDRQPNLFDLSNREQHALKSSLAHTPLFVLILYANSYNNSYNTETSPLCIEENKHNGWRGGSADN